MSKPALKATVASHAIFVAACAAGAPVEWIKLLPYGEVNGRDGRRWTLPRAKASAVLQASLARAAGADLVVDYDHQSDLAAVPGVGGKAPASGWMTALEARDDGIYAKVRWTEGGAAALAAEEYRYVSPVFEHTKSGEIRALLRAALTNTPNLDLPALASEQTTGDDMDYSKIAQALGLGADATEEQILAAIAKFTSAVATAAELAKIRQHLKLADDADGAAVITAIAAQAKAGVEPNEAVIALQSEVNELKAKEIGREVDGFIKAGKIAPASRDDFIALASSDRARFESIVGKAPIIIVPGTTPAGDTGKVVDGKYVLSPDQTALCSQMGWDPEVYAKTKLEEENA